jgi:hypothetical protein
MMSLESIIGNIQEEKAIAEIDLDTVSTAAYPYKQGQVKSAKHKLEGLYIDYKNELLKRAVFILVTGDDAEGFSEIADSEFNCFTTDGDALFKDIVGELNPQLYTDKMANGALFDIVSNILEHKLKHLDIVEYNELMFNTKYSRHLKDKEDCVQLVKEAVTDIVGPEVIGLNALEEVTKEAVNRGYKSRVVPILIFNKDAQFVVDISPRLRNLNPRVVRVAAGKVDIDINAKITLKKTDTKSVGEALKEIAANA